MTDGELTSFAAFEAQENGPEPSEEAEQPAEQEDGAEEAEEQPEVNDEAEEGDEAAKEPPKPKPTAQDRIDELTRKRHEAERRATEAEREAKYYRDVAEGRAKPNGGQAPEETKAPSPDDFDLGETDPKYIEAVIDYRVEKGLDKVRNGVAQDLHIQAAERAWEAKQDAARSEFADYDEKVTAGAHNWPCSPDMAEAIRTSDAGGKIAYHLASHPEEARRIVGLNPYAQVREIGRIEASLEGDKSPAKKTTSAPKPPGNQARGAGGHFAPDASTKDFSAFEAMANRKS